MRPKILGVVSHYSTILSNGIQVRTGAYGHGHAPQGLAEPSGPGSPSEPVCTNSTAMWREDPPAGACVAGDRLCAPTSPHMGTVSHVCPNCPQRWSCGTHGPNGPTLTLAVELGHTRASWAHLALAVELGHTRADWAHLALAVELGGAGPPGSCLTLAMESRHTRTDWGQLPLSGGSRATHGPAGARPGP